MLEYQFALCNVFWSENDINVRHFENITQQNEYFDRLTGGVFAPLSNFNMGDNITTTIVYTDETDRDINELITCNYLVLHQIDESNNIINRRYYFAKVYQDSGRQLIIDISLDDIQTNYIRYNDLIAPCIINRTHLNRFIQDEQNSNLVIFNFTEGSPLFDRETDNLPKRLTKRTRLGFIFSHNLIVDNWLNENVRYWKYVFIDKYHQYNVKNPNNGNDTTTPSVSIQDSDLQDVGCICYPVFKTDKQIYIGKGRGTSRKLFLVNDTGYKYFRNKNDNSSYFFSSKVSIVPPFNSVDEYEIDSDGNLVLYNETYVTSDYDVTVAGINYVVSDYDNIVGVFTNVESQFESFESQGYVTKTIKFNKQGLQGVRVIQAEPKLLSQDFIELNLKSSDGESFTYDFQKINNENNIINFLYTEPIQPEVTKYYARLNTPSGLYIEENSKNYNGLVGSTDNSVSIANDQYSNFIANNKNFFLQSNFKMFESAIKSGISFAESTASGNVGGMVSSLYGMTGGQVSSYYDRKWSIDNLKASPGSLKNASGNVLFNLSVDDIGIYVEEYECLEEDKIKVYDYLFTNGYSYGHIGNINLYDHTRKYFNYLECEVGVISAPISENEKDRLRQRLKQIRFWHTDNIEYSLENYERWLENG